MRLSRSVRVLIGVTLGLWASSPAHAEPNPLRLFGGPNRDHFLGCLNCDPSETFSIWNEEGKYGSPTRPDSIWNRHGIYGSPESGFSPWNRGSVSPPFVVDRAGNFYGYFTRNVNFPDRITRTRSLPFLPERLGRKVLEFLVWFLEDYELIIANLDEVRSNR
jgi:hypothetical protein